MTPSTARDRAIAALVAKFHTRTTPYDPADPADFSCTTSWIAEDGYRSSGALTFGDVVDALAEARALAGEAEPTGDVPPVWWSPSRMSLIRDHGQPRGLVLHAHQHEERLSELPADAVRLVPAGGPAATPERIVTNHAPRAEWSGAWAELGGYVQAAVDSGTQIDPANLLAYMRELRSSALRPVREWMDELMRSAGGTPDETGHHPR